MPKICFLLLVIITLSGAPLMAQGNPFEVDTVTVEQSSRGGSASEQNNVLADQQSDTKKGGFWQNLFDAIRDFFSGSRAGTNSSGKSVGAKSGQTVKHGNAAAQMLADKVAASKEKKAEPPPPPVNKAPETVKPSLPKGKGVSTGSADFKKWFDDAAKFSSDWEFPDVTNKYGKKISREDYLRAIIWIESKGIHASSRGTVTKSWAGALGFMQLMPATARGLKIDPKDPAQNLKGGSKYLKEIFNSGNVSKKSGAEKLIMGACAYNLGPYSKSMKLSWEALKTSKAPVETRAYGLKLKMSLGLELSQDERVLVEKWLVQKGETVDGVIDWFYSNAMGIAR